MTIAKTEPIGSELAISDRQSRFSPAQRVALAHMGVDKAPDEDVDVFFHVCQRTRLDPFARQIYMIGRQANELVDGQWQKVTKYTIQTGIDGYRTIARRRADETGDELSYGDTLWCGADGVWRDVWLGSPQELHAAKATIYRAGKPYTHVALFREYVQTVKDKSGAIMPNSMWANKGANQLAKCAEAGALRKAYPQDYAGLYVDAEMEHLANEAAAAQVVPGQRDFWADADAATTVSQLREIWTAAHRAHALDDRLQAHITTLRERIEHPEQVPDAVDPQTGEVVEAEVVDETTGEVTPAPAPEPAASQPEPKPEAEPEPVAEKTAQRGTQKATQEQRTSVIEHCSRLGIQSDPVERQRYVTLIIGGPVPAGGLTKAQADAVIDVLAKARDRDALDAWAAGQGSLMDGAGQ